MVQTFRHDMWGNVCTDAIIECGIEERWFGPVQATVFELYPNAPMLNSIRGAAEPGAVREGHLWAAIEWADSFDVDYGVPVARGRPGAELAEELLNWKGFEQGMSLTKFARDVRSLNMPEDPAGITVWELGCQEESGETMTVAADALELPGVSGTLLFALPVQRRWRCYTAELEDKVVGFGSMLIDGGIAEFGIDATFEEARERGCNRALLRRRLLDAARAGCHTVFAEIGEWGAAELDEARAHLVHMGFEEAHRSQVWRRPREWRPEQREFPVY